MTVVEGSGQIIELVGDIAKQAEIEADSIAQSSVVQTNSATAEESAAASQELSGQSQLLKSLVDRFKLR